MDSNDLVSLSGQLIETLNSYLGPPPYDPFKVDPIIAHEDFFSRFNLSPQPEEFRLYDRYDCTLAISEAETALIRKGTTITEVEYLPITFAPTYVNNSYSAAPVFVAADNPFNVQAYLFLTCRVIPHMLQRDSQFRIDVIGEVTRKLVAVPGINLVGFVPDLSGVYLEAGFALCPIIGGTGMSVKVVEAMSHGLPVVVLRNKSQDTVVTHGLNGFIANDAAEFAHYSSLLHNDRKLCSLMGKAARETVESSFSNDFFVSKLAGIVERLQQKKIVQRRAGDTSDDALQLQTRPKLKVLFDISVLGLAYNDPTSRTGVFRVVEHLAHGLALSSEIELHFCSTQHFSEHSPLTEHQCLEYLRSHPEFNHIPFHQQELPQVDVFHSPFHALPLEIKATVRLLTIYDLIAIRYPILFQGRYNPVPRILASLRPEDQTLCISQSTRDDLCCITGMAPERTHVTYLAADPGIFHPCDNSYELSAVREKSGIGATPYILSLCTLEPRKNIDHIIRAFAKLVRDGRSGETRLVLVGTKGWSFGRIFSEIDNNSELQHRIVLTGYVADNDLSALYSGATAFVYMSLYEGFGLPPLEAMQCGVPVITSNTSSLPEVVGDAGIMLDPHDSDGLCRALHEVITNHELHAEMSRHSLVQASHFSWNRCVEETIAAYKNAIHDQKGKACTAGEPAIVIDGVIFQLQHARPFGISRLWWSLLTELAATPLAGRIVLLDREGTAPEIPGIRRRRMPVFCLGNALEEALILDQICREEEAGLFVSTYYTFTTGMRSLLILYDMIPERFDSVGPMAPNPEWRDKYHAISNSSAFAAISLSTARDLGVFYPRPAQRPLTVIPCAVSGDFRTHSEEEIAAFKAANGIDRPYFLLVGRRDPHKNAALFFQAFASLPDRESYAIVMAGGGNALEPELRELAGPAAGYAGFFSDQDLSLAYSGAIALVYPSIYEGFGLPILEAMQSGCPVITCQNSSLPEVAGSAALYVGESDREEMTRALVSVQQPDVRGYLIKRGLERARLFSWRKSAELLADAIIKSVHASGTMQLPGGELKSMEYNLSHPLVSAIVSTYNSERFIKGCLEDLEHQTIAHQIEIIVIDSASTQNEGAIVRELQGHYGNIRYLRTDQRETVYAAWNRGIALARGRYVTNANTDDRHRRDAFELMARVMESRPGIDLVYGDVLVTKTPNETFESHTPSGKYTWYDWDRNILLDKGCFIGPQPMWRRSLHELYGGFDPAYVTSGDYEFWLRISQTSDFFHIRQPLGLYLAHPDSIEHQNEDRKGIENIKICDLYRRAAKEGCIVGLMPLQKLGTFAAEKCYGLPYADLTQLIDFIEARLMPRAKLYDNRMGNYHRIKAKLLGNGEPAAQLIEEYVSVVEHLLLCSKEWYVNRRSVEDTTADDALLRLEILSTAVQKARLLFQRNDFDGAVSMLLNQGIKAAASSPVAYLELADILIAAGRYEDALQVLPEMPSSADVCRMQEILAICCAALGQDESARHAALQAGDLPRALVALGTLAARSGNLAEAEAFFRRAVEADPSCGTAWLSLGMLLWGNGNQDGAYQAVRQAVTVDPLNGEAVKILRDMAGRNNRHADALLIISGAVQLYPDSRNLRRQHAELLSQCNQDREALDACEAFLVSFGADEELLSLALHVRHRIGIYDRLAEAGTQSVSLCMIVKNEEKNLPACLASLKPVVDEMIVVDTGSTDRTVDIATIFGAKVLPFPWTGNFSDARNFSLASARGGWILVMDADEVLSSQDHDLLRQTVSGGDRQKICWSVMTRNYTRLHPRGWIANNGSYPHEERAEGWHPSIKIRLFPNDPDLRFVGEVHEMIERTAQKTSYQVQEAPFVVHHYGGLADTAADDREKKEAYFVMGKQKLTEHPNDLPAIGELAVQAAELQLYEEAIELWNRFLALAPDASVALFNKGFALMCLNRFAEALDVTRRVLVAEPYHKEAAFNYGVCALYAGDPHEAIARLEPILQKHAAHPPLLAALTALHLVVGDRNEAVIHQQLLNRINYSISDFIDERTKVLRNIGRNEYAEALEQSSKSFPFNTASNLRGK